MRVIFLVPDVYGMGGKESAVIAQANGFSKSHDVEILSVYRSATRPHFPINSEVLVRGLVSTEPGLRPSSEMPILDENVVSSLRQHPSVFLPRKWDPTYDALADLALESALPNMTADVVVTVTPALLSAATQLVPGRVAIVHQEHRSSAQRTSGMDPLLLFGPRADVIATHTHSMAEWLASHLGPAAPRIEVVPNALPAVYRPRSQLDQPLILAAGRLVREKQYDHMISAFGAISDRLPDWRLRIFGEGFARPDLVGVIRKEGLYDRVELPGFTTDLASEWAKASIGALTSISEGFPLVIQEAMAAGVPFVSYDCPSGPREIIDHGLNGLLVSQGSISGLAAALLRLATSPDVRSSMGEAAIAKATAYDGVAIHERWLEILETAVTRRRGLGGVRLGQRLVARLTSSVESTAHVEEPRSAPPVLYTPAEARTVTLELLAGVASSVSNSWFAIPPDKSTPTALVIPAECRTRFLDRLAEADVPSFLSIRDPEAHGWPERRGTVTEMARYLRRGMTSSMAIEPWPEDADHPGLLGQGCTVVVEFWDSDATGALHAPTLNRFVQRVPDGTARAMTTVEDVKVPTLQLMQGPTATECRFPIDAVYTWVDNTDPGWDHARRVRASELDDPTMLSAASSGTARFRARDELRYSLRSIFLFAPWIRSVHLVTAGQLPSWLCLDDPRISLVDHSDILPADALPTFNSHAIESALFRIPDLAEHFIYFNDDVFLGRPVRPEHFFTPAGQFAVFISPTVVGLPDDDSPSYLKAAANNRRLIHCSFGVTITNTLAHTPHPHRRSVLMQIADRFAPEVNTTAHSPFRSETDVSLMSSLAQHYGLLTGHAFNGDLAYAFVNLGAHNLKRKLDDLLTRDRDAFCLGDHHQRALLQARIDELVSTFLDTYFPLATPWEHS